jgi:hypothetical protein
MTGAPYVVDETVIRNQFLVRIVNKRNAPARFVVTLEGAPANIRRVGFHEEVEVPPLGELVQPLVLLQPRREYTGSFEFGVRIADATGKFSLQRTVEFVGPDARLLREEEKEQRERR